MLDLFRLAGPAKLQPANDVIDFPPRAAGHQIRWSVERVIQLLCRAGRRPLDVSAPCSGRRTAQERLLDSMMQAIARGEEGDEPVALDLAQLVREAAAGFGAHVAVVGPASIAATGRPLALKRAINNLISNAVKYATDVRVTVLDGPHAAEVHVDDNGPGIARDRREEAFRPFSRLDEARTQNTSGTGLGLTLARDTARAHGGDLRLSDSVLGGLRASLRLPH